MKIIHDELARVMGEPSRTLNLRAEPPVVVLLAGLQGAGKTTTAAKLARGSSRSSARACAAREHRRLSPGGDDAARAAGRRRWRSTFPAVPRPRAGDIASEPLVEARAPSLYDVVIVDTAGRLHVDSDMMQEVRDISAAVNPLETLFVVDSMAGQDAVNAARAFGEALTLTGVILTKADGDARGGAALSVRQVTGKPILFIGTGEKSAALEVFNAERVAGRILGMGDVLSLVEQVQAKVDQQKAEKARRQAHAGQGLRLQRPQGAAPAAAEHGRHRGVHGQAAGPAAGRAPPGAGDDRMVKPSGGHHRFDDAARTAPPGRHRRLPPAAHRGGCGRAGGRT